MQKIHGKLLFQNLIIKSALVKEQESNYRCRHVYFNEQTQNLPVSDNKYQVSEFYGVRVNTPLSSSLVEKLDRDNKRSEA